MSTPGEYLRSVVRVFPDYAGTVLWFAPGPVDYADAHLSHELVAAMKAWESLFDEYLSYGAPRSGLDVNAYDAEGVRPCRALADELGDIVGIEYHSDQKGAKKVVVRCSGPGSNPEARVAFERMIAESLQREEESADLGEGGTWTAYVPRSHPS